MLSSNTLIKSLKLFRSIKELNLKIKIFKKIIFL